MVKDILARLSSLFHRDEQITELSPHKGVSAKFILSHPTTSIGELFFDGESWIFRYTDEFKKQSKLSPIVDFPDVDKEYKSIVLFPYFGFRIPSLSQPRIKKIVKQKQINPDNPVDLLKQFGQRTIVNAFDLRMV